MALQRFGRALLHLGPKTTYSQQKGFTWVELLSILCIRPKAEAAWGRCITGYFCSALVKTIFSEIYPLHQKYIVDFDALCS